MKWIEAGFRLALRLYPRSFRARFAEEMQEVFHHGLREARAENRLAPFFLRELAQFPGSLADVYAWAASGQEEGRLALAGAGGRGLSAGSGGPSHSWSASFLAGLPHLLIGLAMGAPMLLSAASPELGKSLSQPLGLISLLLILAALLGVLVYNLRSGWKPWSASWTLYLVFLPAALVFGLIDLLPISDRLQPWMQVITWSTLPPLTLYVIYKIACKNRVSGLLASLPMALALWIFFEEFVPDLLRGSAFLWTWGLAALAAGLILRARRFGLALALALAVTALGGLPFVYLGVYHGGTLPFSEPGPSLREVFRQFMPFLGVTSAILLGPQLAARMRRLGSEARAEGGVPAARLALGGLLLLLVYEILSWSLALNGTGTTWWLRVWNVERWTMVAAAALYVFGLLLLARAGIRSGVLVADERAGRDFALLAAVLPGVPLVLVLLMLDLPAGMHRAQEAVQAVILAWVLLSAWVASKR